MERLGPAWYQTLAATHTEVYWLKTTEAERDKVCLGAIYRGELRANRNHKAAVKIIFGKKIAFIEL